MSVTPLTAGEARKGLTPDTLALPVSKLTRSMIYNEFRWFHHIAGGKANVGNLPAKLYTFDSTPEQPQGKLLCNTDRYRQLEEELDRRRKLDSAWQRMKSRDGFKLQDRFHFKGV